MALPFDDATTLLTTVSNAVRQIYHEDFPDMYNRFGKRSSRVFKFSRRPINGDGINVQVRSYNLNGARFGTDINADFPAARSFGANYYKVTLSEDSSLNHFRRLALSLQTTHLDIKRKVSDKVSASDYAAELVEQAMGNQMEAMAIHRHLDSTARIGVVSGTVYKNDKTDLQNSPTAYTTTGGARFVITSGSLAYFQPGQLVDIYATSTNTKRWTVWVTDYNPADSSVGVYGINAVSGLPDSTVDIKTGNIIAAGDYIYISGEKDANMLSVGHWFSTPTASESFFGRDRTDVNYRWLMTHQSKLGSTATQFSKTDIDNLAIQLGFVQEEDAGGAYVSMMDPALEQRYRNEIGADIIIQYPTAEQQGRMMAEYGFEGSIYRHPQIGRVVLNSDPCMIPGKIRMLKLGDWECLAPLGGDFEWLPGDNGNNWYRMTSSVNGGGKTTTYRMDGMLLAADICTNPRRNAQINNLTA